MNPDFTPTPPQTNGYYWFYGVRWPGDAPALRLMQARITSDGVGLQCGSLVYSLPDCPLQGVWAVIPVPTGYAEAFQAFQEAIV